MKYVISGVTSTKSGRQRTVVKWLLYAVLLILFYTLSRSGAFGFWQPFFILPLCTAVAMHEEELPACVFALFCGLYTDCAFGFVFGFSAFWLINAALCVSVLSRNLVQKNLLNFCWLTACTVFLEFFMDYIFNVLIWDRPNGDIILFRSIIPTAAATMIFSPAVYYLVRAIQRKFSAPRSHEHYEPAQEEAGEEGGK